MSGWMQSDGTPLTCPEKLRMLAENEAELGQMLQDAFEDAILMGVDEALMRARLRLMIDALRRPSA